MEGSAEHQKGEEVIRIGDRKDLPTECQRSDRTSPMGRQERSQTNHTVNGGRMEHCTLRITDKMQKMTKSYVSIRNNIASMPKMNWGRTRKGSTAEAMGQKWADNDETQSYT